LRERLLSKFYFYFLFLYPFLSFFYLYEQTSSGGCSSLGPTGGKFVIKNSQIKYCYYYFNKSWHVTRTLFFGHYKTSKQWQLCQEFFFFLFDKNKLSSIMGNDKFMRLFTKSNAILSGGSISSFDFQIVHLYGIFY
jgi:hypothetical protein